MPGRTSTNDPSARDTQASGGGAGGTRPQQKSPPPEPFLCFFSSGCFEDSQRVAVGKAFHVGGASIRYPGDPQAPGYLIYNCRCTLVSAVKGIDQSGAARASKLGNMSYEEWKAGKG